ncbi:DUF6907 domain-containing protein [Streptomyces sp. NBC_00212]|uniref:DUF6907 domain-containing protein n=1 Tax=Streptomyces sp. NBC_00212 TaxID=2975684 RepID=UPI0032506DE4
MTTETVTTVSPSEVKPSGGIVQPHIEALPAMPAQPHPAGRRIVPALIDCAPIYVDCPSWCTVDHVAENEGALEDLFHSSDMATLFVAHPEPAGPQPIVTVRLNEDPYLIRRDGRGVNIFIDTGSDPYPVDARQADEFADDLVALAAQVRAMARTLAAEDQK